jgi:hypothetical protein
VAANNGKQKHQKDCIVDPLRGPPSSVKVMAPVYFGIHMANEFIWGRKNRAIGET